MTIRRWHVLAALALAGVASWVVLAVAVLWVARTWPGPFLAAALTGAAWGLWRLQTRRAES